MASVAEPGQFVGKIDIFPAQCPVSYTHLPASVPYLLSILKVDSGLCLVGVIIGEFIGAREGLGSVSYTHLESV